jgi:hypothetical protein
MECGLPLGYLHLKQAYHLSFRQMYAYNMYFVATIMTENTLTYIVYPSNQGGFWE